ncbi:MAG: hypothetical protein K2M43_00395 [Mycoplasmoidaceae bacterium]|nr:hypothetical protein [Mycoplasmoidaceae bacterium]
METYGFSKQGSGMTLNSKLKDYFKSNIDDIILEMAGAGEGSDINKAHDTKDQETTKDIFNKNV